MDERYKKHKALRSIVAHSGHVTEIIYIPSISAIVTSSLDVVDEQRKKLRRFDSK